MSLVNSPCLEMDFVVPVENVVDLDVALNTSRKPKAADEILAEMRDENIKLTIVYAAQYILNSLVVLTVLLFVVSIDLYFILFVHTPIMMLTFLFQFIMLYHEVLLPLYRELEGSLHKACAVCGNYEATFQDLRASAVELTNKFDVQKLCGDLVDNLRNSCT